MRRLWDIALTAAVTAIVTTLISNTVADTSAVGRTWDWLRQGLLTFADRAAPVFGVGAVVSVVLWLSVRLALLSRQQDANVLEVDPRLPNPLTVLAYTAVLFLAAALSLGRAASGSDVAAVVACCVGVVALRGALRLLTDVRRVVFGAPF